MPLKKIIQYQVLCELKLSLKVSLNISGQEFANIDDFLSFLLAECTVLNPVSVTSCVNLVSVSSLVKFR